MAKSTTENPTETAAAEEAPTPVQNLVRAGTTPAFVQYIGSADVREIDAKAWANVGVENQGKVVWDKRKFRGDLVKTSDLSPAALEYCATYDDGFVLVDENGKRVG